ncbi:prephenate dehydratase [Flavobacterium luminosum]|uniref:prephenate dehydratase n=1 Tax=Flavobacterium luminosum TaxID=2949086 RepID=A0ABT0TPF6_9FLAO|nr:prephenate dehydratase [Flavobacterium sp. HXWNR70]MCL9809377.1 prephenate dehydratase [Flavobacterium sp. HXWNR70]
MVAIQGIKGSFHHQVAQNYFGVEQEILICHSFREVANQLKNKEATTGVMAIENSIAGTILPNYALIDTFDLQIIGEYFLNIDMHFMALPDQSIEDIHEVHSHPIALLQCANFFEDYPHIKLVESSDTAFAAKQIKEKQLKGIGALAGPIASDLYDLEILAKSVHTVKSNKTRFVILKNKDLEKAELSNKASLKFELDDTPGSLATVLNVLNNCKLNLTKIQSLPIIEQPFQYSFFVDVVFEKYKHYEKAKKLLEIMTTHFKVLGEYQAGEPQE